MEIITQSAQQTQELGEKIGRDLITKNKGPKIFCLYGDLGSGKTTFIQGLARGLKIKQRIISPTFIFVRQYKIPPPKSLSVQLGGGKRKREWKTFYHIDLYRIEKPNEAKVLGLEEIFSDPKAIVAIEWAEKIASLLSDGKKMLPGERIDICFQYIDDKKRKISLFQYDLNN